VLQRNLPIPAAPKMRTRSSPCFTACCESSMTEPDEVQDTSEVPCRCSWGTGFFRRHISSDDSDLTLEPNLELADDATAHADPWQTMPAMNIEIAV
jgi:hypothetical protein